MDTPQKRPAKHTAHGSNAVHTGKVCADFTFALGHYSFHKARQTRNAREMHRRSIMMSKHQLEMDAGWGHHQFSRGLS